MLLNVFHYNSHSPTIDGLARSTEVVENDFSLNVFDHANTKICTCNLLPSFVAFEVRQKVAFLSAR